MGLMMECRMTTGNTLSCRAGYSFRGFVAVRRAVQSSFAKDLAEGIHSIDFVLQPVIAPDQGLGSGMKGRWAILDQDDSDSNRAV